jgi:hypothetical protein
MAWRPRIGRGAGRLLDRGLARLGLRLVDARRPRGPDDLDHAETVAFVREHTMTSPERVRALCDAVQHVVRHGIPGAIVECGVWRGGSMMAVARTLVRLGATDRDLYLFDTYEGMTPPGPQDRDMAGRTAAARLAASGREDWVWAIAPLDVVRQGMDSTGYPAERVHYVVGRVEETVPGRAPDGIAVLRLDTDWYGSTRHELEHLYPRLARGGVLILDDYGHWQGARQATDEYLERTKARLLLTRIDGEGRLAVKVDS